MSPASVVIHVGYPKTATTTFQKNVFPHHPEIDYLGKFIPSYRYRDELTYHQIDALLHDSELQSPNIDPLRNYVEGIRLHTDRKVVLISSESFIHPTVIDIATVAKRVREAFGDCRILITIREQIGAILSFYWMHGRHGQYLSIDALESSRRLVFPLPFSEWIDIQMRALNKNYLATLKYHEVVSHYAKLFGKENIRVLMFETFLQSPDLYARQLGEVLGVDESALKKLMENVHENQSEGRSAPWSLQDAGHLQGKWSRLLDILKMKKNQGLAASDMETIASLQDFYRQGNRRLMEEFGVPTDVMGYAV